MVLYFNKMIFINKNLRKKLNVFMPSMINDWLSSLSQKKDWIRRFLRDQFMTEEEMKKLKQESKEKLEPKGASTEPVVEVDVDDDEGGEEKLETKSEETPIEPVAAEEDSGEETGVLHPGMGERNLVQMIMEEEKKSESKAEGVSTEPAAEVDTDDEGEEKKLESKLEETSIEPVVAGGDVGGEEEKIEPKLEETSAEPAVPDTDGDEEAGALHSKRSSGSLLQTMMEDEEETPPESDLITPAGEIIDDNEEETEDEGKEEDEDEEEEDNVISETMKEKIINKLDDETQKAIKEWNKENWKKYTKKDLVNLFKKLSKRNSILLKEGHIENLDVEKLVLLMYQSGSLDDLSENDEMTREERVQYMLEGREDTKSKWTSRASLQGNYDKALYDNLNQTLSFGESFFGEGETNEDNINKIGKVADLINEFKLVGINPLSEFKQVIKEVVNGAGKALTATRQMSIDIRNKINSALKTDPTLSDLKNRDLKKYYNIWLKNIGKESVKEFSPEDIDPLLVDNKYEYLTKVESAVKAMLDGIWENGYDSKTNDVKLNPKKQAIIKYFSEFLEKSEEALVPLGEIKSERSNKREMDKLSRERMYKEDEDDLYGSYKKKSAKGKTGSDHEPLTLRWSNLRSKVRMYALILIKFHNKHKDKIRDDSEIRKFNMLKKQIVEQLKKGESQFDPYGTDLKNVPTRFREFEEKMKQYKEEILSITHITPDKFDEKIEKMLKDINLTKELKEEHYELPEFE